MFGASKDYEGEVRMQATKEIVSEDLFCLVNEISAGVLSIAG